jgi:hypothetical protein
MCAIDALGIPPMLGTDAVITAADPRHRRARHDHRHRRARQLGPAGRRGPVRLARPQLSCRRDVLRPNQLLHQQEGSSHLGAHPPAPRRHPQPRPGQPARHQHLRPAAGQPALTPPSSAERPSVVPRRTSRRPAADRTRTGTDTRNATTTRLRYLPRVAINALRLPGAILAKCSAYHSPQRLINVNPRTGRASGGVLQPAARRTLIATGGGGPGTGSRASGPGLPR